MAAAHKGVEAELLEKFAFGVKTARTSDCALWLKLL